VIGMPIAAYQALCIDAADQAGSEAFYAALLGLQIHRGERGNTWLAGPTPQHLVWINQVAEHKSVKNRIHLDVHCGSIEEVTRLGARVLVPQNGEIRWTVLADPEGQEFCAFVRAEPPSYRLYEIVVDCADPAAVAGWWGEVFGARAHDQGPDSAYLEAVPGVPFEAFSFNRVPEPKAAKNRVHWDVDVDSVELLTDVGATVLRAPDDEIRWTIMADPEGNEFCAFVRET
jgi:catechol 2,3-dioxygenase-like lactoylglutathione lyase family enzyme